MSDLLPRVLIVDDEPFNVEILMEYLEDGDFELESAKDGQEAWEKLEANPDFYDVVILDRMMPRMNGMQVLEKIKAHAVLKSVPVILQTAMAAKKDVLEGIKAGAHYYLTKPFDEELLLTVLDTAISDRMRYRRAQIESDVNARTFGLMCEGRFFFKTLDAARDLATVLSNACPDPKRVSLGMAELLVNAVEHGNLGISYDEKSELRANQGWDKEIERRLCDPVYVDKQVEVTYQRTSDAIQITIVDQGAGFDWKKYLEIDPERAFDTHGRGIAMSRIISFDSMEYKGKGNEVQVKILVDDPACCGQQGG